MVASTYAILVVEYFLIIHGTDALFPNALHPPQNCPSRPENWKTSALKERCQPKCRKSGSCKNRSRECVCDGPCGMSCVKKKLTCPELLSVPNGRMVVVPHAYEFAAVVKYQCDAGYTLFGPMERQCQGDGRWSGTQPVCRQTAKCPPPPVIPYGQHDREGEDDFTVDTVLKYSCIRGYVRLNAQRGLLQARCIILDPHQGTRWYGPELQCVARHCGLPDEPMHGKVESDNIYQYGAQARYSCFEGYDLQGPSVRICQENGRWTGLEPVCKAKECPRPVTIANGQPTGDSVQFKSTITYQCDSGYRIRGDRQRTCLADQTWSGVEPYCEQIFCPSPGPLYNGFIEGQMMIAGSQIRFRCLDEVRYQLVGEEFAVCVDEHWSPPLPKCLAIRCPPLAPLWNGWIEGGQSRTLGSRIYFYCNAHSTHEEGTVPYAWCVGDGQWSFRQQPRCNARCQVPLIDHGEVTNFKAGALVNDGTWIQINCEKNFELSYPKHPACKNGTWDVPTPSCVPIRCKTWPSSIQNGIVIFTKTDHDTVARYRCNPGYELKGDAKVRCLYGEWRGSVPKCVERECVNALHHYNPIENGRIMLEGRLGVYVYTDSISSMTEGRVIFFECDKGYLLAEYCDHPSRSVGKKIGKNGRIMLEGSMGTYVYADYIRSIGEMRNIFFECDKGFYLRGAPKATCVDGQWLPEGQPTCEPQLYPVLEDRIMWEARRRRRRSAVSSQPFRRRFSRRRFNSPRSEAVLFTDDADDLSADADESYGDSSEGDSVRMTTAMGATNRTEEYNSYLTVTEASVDLSERVRQTAPAWELRQKYRKVGKLYRQALLEANFCLPLYDTRRQIVKYLNYGPLENGSVPSGAEAHVACVKGYFLNDQLFKYIRCQNGTWYPGMPKCLPKRCVLPHRDNAFYLYNSEIVAPGTLVKHNTGAQMFCLRDYDLQDNQDLECNLGDFTRPPGQCIPKSCVVPFLRYGEYKLNPTPPKLDHNMMLEFTCTKPGFSPYPTTGEVYCWFGKFRPDDPICQQEVEEVHVIGVPSIDLSPGCDRPVDVENAWVYRHGLSGTRQVTVLVNQYQSVLPNDTIVHYKCANSTGPLKLQANAIRCIGTEWVALLADCADPYLPPVEVENSPLSTVDRIVLQGHCDQPQVPSDVVVISQMFTNQQVGWSTGFPSGTKLQLRCLLDTSKLWMIECQDSVWLNASSVNCEQKQRNLLCNLDPRRFHHVQIFDHMRGAPVSLFDRKFSNGTRLTFRCEHVGMFKLTGAREFHCNRGQWEGGAEPVCAPLNEVWNHFRRAAPITYTATDGDLVVGSTGNLIVRTSSTVHLDCLFPRKNGDPKWEVTNSYRHYPRYWANNTARYLGIGVNTNFSQLPEVYRLSIYGARPEDSGTFSCITPSRQRHSVQINVTDVECPTISLPTDSKLMLLKRTRANWISSVAVFGCMHGFALIGESYVFCLEDGQWSKPMPECSAVLCPTIQMSHHALRANVTSLEYKGHATFTCTQGYLLHGPSVLYCSAHGNWSDPVPSCKEIVCTLPDTPATTSLVLGRKDKYLFGDVVIYDCAPDLLMEGNNTAQCSHNGRWTSVPPECKTICRFPGKPAFGRTNLPPRAYYQVGEKVTYLCGRSYRLVGSQSIECGPDGNWSQAMPYCRPESRRRKSD